MAEITKERVYSVRVEGVDSVNELKAAIDELNERLKTLNETSKEYKETLEKLTELQGKLADAMKQISDSAENTSDSINEIKESIEEMGETIVDVKESLQDFGDIDTGIIDAFVEGFVDGMNEVAGTVDEVADGFDKINENSFEGLSGNLDSVGEALNGIKSDAESTEESIESLNNSNLDKLNDTISGVSDTIHGISTATTETKTKIEELNGADLSTMKDNIEGVSGELEKISSAADDVTKSTDKLDEALTKDAETVKELRDQIGKLKDRLVTLKVDSDEYRKTVDLLVEKNNKLQSVMQATSRAVSGASGSYNALSQEMSALRKRWKETNDEAERSQIGKRIAEINDELKKMDASIGNFQRNVGDYTNSLTKVFGNPREQIRKLRQELATLEVGSERYNEVLTQMADLTQKQKHFQDQLAFSSSNLEDIFKNMAGVAGGVVAGFSSLNAVMGLFGDENDDVQEAMLKTQRLMAIVQGLNGLAGLKDQLFGLIDGIKGYVSRFGLLNKSTKEFGDSAKGAAASSKLASESIKQQASSTEQLFTATEKLNEAERAEYETLQDRRTEVQANISILDQEISELEKKSSIMASTKDAYNNEHLAILDEIDAKKELLHKNEQEDVILEKAQKRKIEEATSRKENVSALEQEVMALQEQSAQLDETIEHERERIELTQMNVESIQNEISSLQEELNIELEKENVDETTVGVLESLIAKREDAIAQQNKIIANSETEIALAQQKKKQIDAEIATKSSLIAKEKMLSTELQKYNKWQVLSIASTKLDIANTKALAASKTMLAITTKAASVALKGLKAALISTGIGAIIVLLGELLNLMGKGLSSLWNWIKGTEKHKAALAEMNEEIERTQHSMENFVNLMQAKGASTYKLMEQRIKDLVKIIELQKEAYDYAAAHFKESSDEVKDSLDALTESQKKLKEMSESSLVSLEKMLSEIEKADRQSGMTQLEKDMEELNIQFTDALDLVSELRIQGELTAKEMAEMTERIIEAHKMAMEQLKAKSSGSTGGGKSEWQKQKEEAEKLYNSIVENSKDEVTKLREKYEKEKALLEKFGMDTTELTKQFYKSLDDLLTKRNKEEYDKWKAHLDSVLGLIQKDTVEFFEKEIENLEKAFEVDFGAGFENPFEDFFDLEMLDEFGSKAWSVSEDIKESMERLGLDPHNFDDIQTMIDKWYADKKAIEDAKKALDAFKSNLKFTEFEKESTKLEGGLEKMLQSVENEFNVLETESAKIFGKQIGFYTGLSPKDLERQFNERYEYMEIGLQQEYDLWLKASQDQTLTVEDRNKAIEKLNEVMLKQSQMAVQKEIDANNLLIKSFERVSDSINSMATNMANILGSVSDIIMSVAEKQLEAGEITQEEYKAQFEKSKKIQIAQATINTIAGAVGAFMGITRDTGGWGIAAAAIEAAAVLAAGFAQIYQIQNTNVDSSSSSAGGSGSNTFQLPSVMVPEPTRVQNTTNQSDIDELKNALGDQKVYVVESDIQAATNKSNKRQTEVTF